MRAHAAEIIAERLASAEPRNGGRQTPYRNHPVFVAQHALGHAASPRPKAGLHPLTAGASRQHAAWWRRQRT
jgi:hypothetical protein